MSDRKPLVGLVGTIGRDPETKTTPKGQIIVTSLAVSDGFGEEAKTTWYNLAVWHEELQKQVKEQVYKGAQVAIQGVVTPREGYQPDVNVVRIGLVTWFSRQPQQQAQPVAEEDEDF